MTSCTCAFWSLKLTLFSSNTPSHHLRLSPPHPIPPPHHPPLHLSLSLSDLSNQRLYWVDSKLHMLSSVDLSGARRQVLLSSQQHLRHPFALSVFQVGWEGDDGGSVFVCGISGCGFVYCTTNAWRTCITTVTIRSNRTILHQSIKFSGKKSDAQ